MSWTVPDEQQGSFLTNSDHPGVFVAGTRQGPVELVASFQYLDHPVMSNQIDLLISSATLVSISVSSQNRSIPLGSVEKFVATGVFSDQSSQDLTEVVQWSLSDTSMAYLIPKPVKL